MTKQIGLMAYFKYCTLDCALNNTTANANIYFVPKNYSWVMSARQQVTFIHLKGNIVKEGYM